MIPSLITVIGGGPMIKNAMVLGLSAASADSFNDADIQELFAGGKVNGGAQGLFYNASRQNDAVQMTDLSGNGNHGIQANSTSRALLVTHANSYKSLQFDGVDDGYLTQNINLSHTDSLTFIVALAKTTTVSRGAVLEFNPAVTGSGRFNLHVPLSNEIPAQSFAGGSIVTSKSATDESLKSAQKLVIARKARVSTGLSEFYINKTLHGSATSDMGVGNFGNYQLSVGIRGSLAFAGNIYALLVIDRLLTEQEIAKVEKYFAKLAGITL